MAFITVTDAAGRVLFRRAATQSEIDDAVKAASIAEAEAGEAMARIAAAREQHTSTMEFEQ